MKMKKVMAGLLAGLMAFSMVACGNKSASAEKTDAKGFAFQMKPDPYDFEIGSAGRSGATIE